MDDCGFGESHDSDSNKFDESSEEEGDGEEEDPHKEWRESVPDYHRETLSVLEEITEASFSLNIIGYTRANGIAQSLIKYLMSGEDLAMEMVKDFETEGEKIIQILADSHSQEYKTFRLKIEEGKERVARAAESMRQLVDNGIDEIEKANKELEGGKRDMEAQYEELNDVIERMLGEIDI
jgi:uncharacterized protein YkuJ